MTEANIYEHVAHYMRVKHPGVVLHFDLSGVHNPSPVTRSLYSRLNGRAWPDLYIAEPTFFPVSVNACGGLFLEIKSEGTRLKKRDGSWASPHIAEQAEILRTLQSHGFIAQFSVGLDETLEFIESYLSLAPGYPTAEDQSINEGYF